MKRTKQQSEPSLDGQLERVIEPLASYISAANRPRAALLSAVAALARVVEETNTIANAHVATYLDVASRPIGRSSNEFGSAI